jgi:hypothetical protein
MTPECAPYVQAFRGNSRDRRRPAQSDNARTVMRAQRGGGCDEGSDPAAISARLARFSPEDSPLKRSQANLLLLAVALIWGSAFVAQAQGMAGVGPLTFTGIRFLLGTALIAAARLARVATAGGTRQPDRWPSDALARRALGVLLMLGAALQQIGITSTTVTNAGFLTALYVPLVPLLAWLILRTQPALVGVADIDRLPCRHLAARRARRASIRWPATSG